MAAAPLLTLLVTTVGCARDASSTPAVFVPVADGVEYATLRVSPGPDQQGADVHVIRIDWRRAEIVARHDASLNDAEGFRRELGAVAAVNGHFFDPAWKPLGLLVSQGVRLAPVRRVDHAVFYVARGRPGLVHPREQPVPTDVEFAIQCGPRLLMGGKQVPVRPGLARRTVIGADRQGRVLLAASAGVLPLAALASALGAPAAAGGIEAWDLLNLDGGSSTMFDLDAARLRAAVRSPVRVPVGLAVRPRRAGQAATSPAAGPEVGAADAAPGRRPPARPGP